jgi:hypothetical protein
MSRAQLHFGHLLRIFPWEILLPHTPSGDNFPCPVDPQGRQCVTKRMAADRPKALYEALMHANWDCKVSDQASAQRVSAAER